MVDREVLAQRVIDGVGSVAAKLKELEGDIRVLWKEFDNLPKDQTIMGCRTKTEFCRKHLHRTPRAIQYLLAGREHCSRSGAWTGENEVKNQTIDLLYQLECYSDVLPSDLVTSAGELLSQILEGRGFDLTGQTFDDGNLYVHERFEQAPRDKSWVWLVENKKTGKAELWRSCDLTRIERRGQRRNKGSYGTTGESGCQQRRWQEWMLRAEERLAEIQSEERMAA